MLDDLAKVLVGMGDAPKFHTKNYDPPPGYMHCACGKKFIPISEMKFHDTDFIKGVTDCLCKECEPDVRNMAYIVCVKCKSVVSRIQPMRFKHGFQIRPKAFYHTNACPDCVKDISKSVILEKYFFDKENGVAVPTLIQR